MVRVLKNSGVVSAEFLRRRTQEITATTSGLICPDYLLTHRNLSIPLPSESVYMTQNYLTNPSMDNIYWAARLGPTFGDFVSDRKVTDSATEVVFEELCRTKECGTCVRRHKDALSFCEDDEGYYCCTYNQGVVVWSSEVLNATEEYNNFVFNESNYVTIDDGRELAEKIASLEKDKVDPFGEKIRYLEICETARLIGITNPDIGYWVCVIYRITTVVQPLLNVLAIAYIIVRERVRRTSTRLKDISQKKKAPKSIEMMSKPAVNMNYATIRSCSVRSFNGEMRILRDVSSFVMDPKVMVGSLRANTMIVCSCNGDIYVDTIYSALKHKSTRGYLCDWSYTLPDLIDRDDSLIVYRYLVSGKVQQFDLDHAYNKYVVKGAFPSVLDMVRVGNITQGAITKDTLSSLKVANVNEFMRSVEFKMSDEGTLCVYKGYSGVSYEVKKGTADQKMVGTMAIMIMCANMTSRIVIVNPLFENGMV